MDELFVEVFSETKTHLQIVPLETVITLLTYKFCKNPQVNLNLVLCSVQSNPKFEINLMGFTYNAYNEKNIPENAKSCVLPIIITDQTTVIAGLCAVSRQIVKSSKDAETQELLGFRNACLMSPNESSVWTKYCEIDLITAVKEMICSGTLFVDTYMLSEDFARFECHLKQPVRAHNVYKIARQQANQSLKPQPGQNLAVRSYNVQGTETKHKTPRAPKARKFKSKNLIEIPSCTPIENLNLEHKFAEGLTLTLADVILFPCFYIALQFLKCNHLVELLPLTFRWYELVLSKSDNKMKNALRFLNINYESHNFPKHNFKCLLPETGNYSLYKSDPKRFKPRNRNFTKQGDIERSLDIISKMSLRIVRTEPIGSELDFNWDMFPFDALPEGGSLPEKRLKRKTEQLENLAKTIMTIASPGDHIVDFCCGSGHLGIILAVMLPLCKITLLDNKEESLTRAKIRVVKLGLTNVSFYQCNLDFFQAEFDIGTSLHACGVATDLVIQHCLNKHAHFVCCPCCYGNVHNCHHLTYPRSKIFKCGIDVDNYLVIGHGADQTHDKNNLKTAQGEICMDIIDHDRALQAMEYGYEVKLSKLNPANCTPKNNLLVGMFQLK